MNLNVKLVFLFAIAKVVYSDYDLNVVHLEQLSRNFEKIFENREHDTVLTIVVNQQGFFAHKNILSSFSSYLREQIKKSKTKDNVIKLPYLELAHNDSFFQVLRYMYTGQLILNNQDIHRLFDLMSISKKLELTNLNEEISLLLANGLKRDNVALILEKANSCDQKKLKASCEDFITHNVEVLVGHKSLLKLSSQCLEEIIDKDSFGVDEIQIFELVKEWHEYNNRTNNLNIDLIRKIRFDLISNEDLLDITSYSKFMSEIIHPIIEKRLSLINTLEYTRQIHNKLASGSCDLSIKIWNVSTSECIRTLTGHSGYVQSLQLLPNYKLASGATDNLIKIWNVESGECIRTLTGHSGHVKSLKMIDNNILVSGSDDKLIKIWNLDSGECIRTLTGHTHHVWSLQLLPNNKLASGSADFLIKIWNIDVGECIRTFTGHSCYVRSLQLISNNKLTSASDDKSIKLWNIDTGECIRTLTGHLDVVVTLQLLTNNKLASGSYDRSIKIWHIDTGECLRTLTGHSNHVYSLQLLSNNKLASGSADNTIKIWDVDYGGCIRTLKGHSCYVYSLELITYKL